MTNIISVEYEVLVGIKVDMDTGTVVEVIAHTEEFNGVTPHQVWAGGYENYEMEADQTLPEYLPIGHPLRDRAEAIADTVVAAEVHVPYTIKNHADRTQVELSEARAELDNDHNRRVN